MKPVAVTQYSIRTTKQFPYRADPNQQFTNRIYFDGGAVGDTAAMHTFMDACVLLEKTLYFSDVEIVKADMFAPGSDLPIASKAYTTLGTGAWSAGSQCPGDCAAVLRHSTTKLSTKNHTVYVFSYFHGVWTNAASTTAAKDTVFPAQHTAIDGFGSDWHNGFVVAGRTYKRTTPDGHLVTGHSVSEWVGHRDFLG